MKEVLPRTVGGIFDRADRARTGCEEDNPSFSSGSGFLPIVLGRSATSYPHQSMVNENTVIFARQFRFTKQ